MLNHRSSTRAGALRVQPTGYKAFEPKPLPPSPPIAWDDDLAAALGEAERALGRLDGVATTLPSADLFVALYVRREAVLSSQIEGTQSSLSDLLLFELEEAPGVPFDDVVEVSNYVGALEHGMARLREELVPKIRQFFQLPAPATGSLGAKPAFVASTSPPQPSSVFLRSARMAPKVVAIGVSTGGPTALGSVLPALPGDYPLPVLIVQHMPPLFTHLLAESLNTSCRLASSASRSAP